MSREVEALLRVGVGQLVEALAGVLPPAIATPFADYRELVEGAVLDGVRRIIDELEAHRVDVEAREGVPITVTIEE